MGDRLNLLTVVGARPQFVKAAAVHRRLRQHHTHEVAERYLHTGQHYDVEMNEVFFRELELPRPEVNLGIGSGPPAYQLGAMMQGIEACLRQQRPDVVLVYGDTNSTLAAAIAASRAGVPVAHVEAGLRSGQKDMQEESNRLLTDHLSSLLFVPTGAAVENLRMEGITHHEEAKIDRPWVMEVGDVMLDNLLHYLDRARPPEPAANLPEEFALATVHRAEVVNNPSALAEMVTALIAADNELHLPLVVPLHPATRKRLDRLPGRLQNDLREAGVHLLPPASYLEMLWLLQQASLVLTDSGGLQKEAAFLGKTCVVLRDTTEWVELEREHLCVVGGTSATSVLNAVRRAPPGDAERARELFGGGDAAARVCSALVASGGRT